MAHLRPFRGVRPPALLVKDVAAPPYDVVNRDEAFAYARGNPKSFFHISRPEIDLPKDVDEHAPGVYDLGSTNLHHFLAQGWLHKDSAPSFYVYRQRMGAHEQVGLVAAASVEEYERGLIKKHEHTRPDKEDDRTHHIDKLAGNDEPVFLTYRARQDVDLLIKAVTNEIPAYDFVSEDGVAHTFWVVHEPQGEKLQEAFARIPELYIADGHHRSAAASRVRSLMRSRGKTEGGQDHFLAVVFPHDQMQILAYNRVVKDLNGLSPAQFMERVAQKFTVQPTATPAPTSLHDFGMYLGGAWYRLTANPGSFPETPLGVLDVSILQENLLQPVLGIADPRKDQRIAFVGGIRGTAELERWVTEGRAAVAFSMYPTRLEQLMAIADAGGVMPPKSTWFEPKLRSGLVLHLFE